jgi:tRNA(fMet)-specific endonuclease VapC
VSPWPGFVAFAPSHPRRLGIQRQIIGSNDLWIAAHAISANLTLVTNNEREFRRIPALKIANWSK